jgi:hypothetical protein
MSNELTEFALVFYSNSKIVGTSRTIHRPRLLLAGSSPRQGQTSHLGPSLLHHMEHVTVHTLDLSSLFEVSGRTPEEACIQVREVCRIYAVQCIRNVELLRVNA